VLTGAGGRIATRLRGGLASRVERLRLVDLETVHPEHDGEESWVADLRDRAAVQAVVAGAHGVLHLGGLAGEADFHDLAAVNIVGTFHVLEAARRSGTERVILASSNHVTGLYPTSDVVSPQMPVRPDSLYGVSKAAGEALGRMYAEKFGVRVASLRIGTFDEVPGDARALSTWLSPEDALAAAVAVMSAPSLTYAALYVSSRNTRRWWDLSAGEELGFDPRDDAEHHAARLGTERAQPGDAVQGGVFAEAAATLPWLAQDAT
jgi:uronate dehydrogenase